jgi:hypothetical protein
MGMFDWLTGTKRPATGVAPKPAADVRSALLAVSRPTAPFIVRDGAPEQVDLVAEWRIVDASWHEIFAKAGLKKVFKVLMRLDPQKHEVRAVDQEWSVEWRAGIPSLALAAESFRGQKAEFSFGAAYAFTEAGGHGEVYRYKFSTAGRRHRRRLDLAWRRIWAAVIRTTESRRRDECGWRRMFVPGTGLPIRDVSFHGEFRRVTGPSSDSGIPTLITQMYGPAVRGENAQASAFPQRKDRTLAKW